MSQIAFFSPAAHGHINPMLPVAKELVRRGHLVRFYCGAELRPAIERAGAAFGALPGPERTVSDFATRFADGNLARVSALLLRETERLLPFVLEAMARETPDLVVFDGMALWGRMAATLLGLRAVATIPTFIFEGTEEARLGARDLLRMLRWLPAGVAPLFLARRRLIRRYGAAAFPPLQPLFPARGDLNISFTVRALHPNSPVLDPSFRFVGPSIDPQTRGGAQQLGDLEQGTVVYISLGTVHAGRVDFYKHCLAAFGDHPARFILAAGQQTDLAALDPIPANFIVRPVVPQLAVLRRADVFITHGGMNSVHEALYFGVPMLLIPQQFEQLFVARAMAARGVGRVLEGMVFRDRVATADLRRELAAILADVRYGAAARGVQKTLRASGGYRQAADEIQAFLG